MAYQRLEHRPGIDPTSHYMAMLYKGSCWHFDAWLLLAADGRVIVQTETRAGGRELLTLRYWLVEHDTALRALRTDEAVTAVEGATRVSLHSRALAGRYDMINRVHWTQIRPLAMGPLARGFRSRSVMFHYAHVQPVAPTDDGLTNYYTYSKKTSDNRN